MDKSPEHPSSKEVLPLHRRRFDAKHRALPDELHALPNAVTPRVFCADLMERLNNNNNEDLKALASRTSKTAAAIVATEDAFDHLDNLYRLADQLMTLKDQNSKIQRRIRDMEHLKKLQEVHLQIEREMIKSRDTDPEGFFKLEATSMDTGEEYEYTEALLDSMLAAGRNASLKRAKWKSPSRSKLRQSIVRNQRSRSMGGEELESCPLPEIDYASHFLTPYKGRGSLRRSSEASKSDQKSKISKWTRVKAAFKWEKAHTGISEDPHTPPPQIPIAKSSVSLVPASPSSGITPASVTPATSTEDVREIIPRRHDGTRRSRSLDSAVVLDPNGVPLNPDEELSSPNVKSHKTPWGKMKNIIQTRKESVRKKQNRNSIRLPPDGRASEHYASDAFSQSESAVEVNDEEKSPKRKISNQENQESSSDAGKRATPTLTLTLPSSEELTHNAAKSLPPRNESVDCKAHQVLRKQKSLDITKKTVCSLSAFDSSDPDTSSSPMTQRNDSKWKKVKKAFLTSAPASTPSSPSRTSGFFSYEPEDLNKPDEEVEEQIRRDYKALQNRLDKEFSEKFADWGAHLGNSRKSDEWEKIKPPSLSGKFVSSSSSLSPTDDKMSDFKKKTYDWQKTKSLNPSANPYACIPSQSQLSDDFRKKLEEWKKLKATNSVPSYTGDESDRTSKEHEKDERQTKHKKTAIPPKKEVLVQTGAGCFRFEGISRSFTRKLYEWEKSKGIAPEFSTSALLRESLARPPLPTPRTMGYGPWTATYQRDDHGILRLQRSQSVGSVRDETIPHISTSASSLSLNHLDDCNNDHRGSDVGDFDTSLENRPVCTESDSDGGPGAVLVEIEDEVEETAAPLVACSPCADPQTPVYRYGQAQERHRACENTERKLSPITQGMLVPPHSCTQKLSMLKNAIGQLIQEEQTIQKLLIGRKNVRERRDDVSKKIEELKGNSSKITLNLGDLERRISRLNKEEEVLLSSLKEKLKVFKGLFDKFVGSFDDFRKMYLESMGYLSDNINKLYKIVESLNKPVIERIHLLNSNTLFEYKISENLKNISTCLDKIEMDYNNLNCHKKENNLCVSYIVSKPKLSNDDQEVIIVSEPNENIKDSQSMRNDVLITAENSNKRLSCSDDNSNDSSKGAKKKIRTSSEKLAKRKSKSRQRLERELSIPTDSDTEKEINTVTVEFPKRKKPFKPRYSSESQMSFQRQNSFEKHSNTDSGDNVFVLKLRAGTQGQAPINQKVYEKESSVAEGISEKAIIMKKRSIDNFFPCTSDEHSKNDSLEILIPEQLSFSLPTEGLKVQTMDVSSAKQDVFVKTTRKIFSPIRRDSSGETKAVIGFDLEDIANSIKNQSDDSKQPYSLENLPDVILNNEKISEQSSKFDMNKSHSIFASESLNNIKSHSPSPLSLRKQAHSNSFPKMIPVSRNESEESLNHSKDFFSNRRGSGERYSKGSPILSRASTPGGPNSLPPLPASPPTSRREKPPAKETAPSIRIMIQKYNMRLNEEGAETRSQNGSSTPPWRSPRSQERFPHENRRMLQQTVKNNPFINREVQKSASASQIMRNQNIYNESKHETQNNIKENINTSVMTPPLPKKLLRGILKSSSAGSLKSTTPFYQNNDNMEAKVSNDTLILRDETTVSKSNKINETNNLVTDSKIPKPIVKPECSSNIQFEDIKSNLQYINSPHIYGKKIDLDLIKIVKSSTCIPIQTYNVDNHYVPSESSHRAMKLRKAKEQFFASSLGAAKKDNENGIRKDRNTSSNVDLAENRLSQISFSSDVSFDADSSRSCNYDNSTLIKSASVGMINVEREAFEKLNKHKNKQRKEDCHNSKSGSKFALSNLASKFRKVRLRSKSKHSEKCDEKEKLDTVTKLCRQSLLVNLHGANSINYDTDQSESKCTNEVLKSKTDKSIVLAGKTGSAVAVSNEEVFAPIDKTFFRSISSGDGVAGYSKRS